MRCRMATCTAVPVRTDDEVTGALRSCISAKRLVWPRSPACREGSRMCRMSCMGADCFVLRSPAKGISNYHSLRHGLRSAAQGYRYRRQCRTGDVLGARRTNCGRRGAGGCISAVFAADEQQATATGHAERKELLSVSSSRRWACITRTRTTWLHGRAHNERPTHPCAQPPANLTRDAAAPFTLRCVVPERPGSVRRRHATSAQ